MGVCCLRICNRTCIRHQDRGNWQNIHDLQTLSPRADDENVPLQSRFLLCRKMNVSNCALIDWNQTDMDSYNDRKGLQGVRRLFFWVFWIFWTKIDLDENRFELPRTIE